MARFTKHLGDVLSLLGFLTFIASAILTAFYWMRWMIGHWGWTGGVAGVLLGPLAALFPFIEWAVDGLPVMRHLMVWMAGVLGVFVGMIWVQAGAGSGEQGAGPAGEE